MVPQQRGSAFYEVSGMRIEYVSQAADQKYHLYLLGDEPGDQVVLYLWDPVVLNGIPLLDGTINFSDPVTVIQERDSVFTIQPP